MTKNTETTIDEYQADPSGRTDSALYIDNMRTLAWFNHFKRNFPDNQCDINLNMNICTTLGISTNNLNRYSKGKGGPSKTRLNLAEKTVCHSKRVFTHGPESSLLWMALSPYYNIDYVYNCFIESLGFHPKVLGLMSYNFRRPFYELEDDGLTEDERRLCRSKSISDYKSTNPFILSNCLEIEPPPLTPSQEITKDIINFRFDKFNCSQFRNFPNIEALLTTDNVDDLCRWYDLEETLCEHTSTIRYYGLTHSDFAWILFSDDKKSSVQHTIDSIRKNSFSANYQMHLEKSYGISGALKE